MKVFVKQVINKGLKNLMMAITLGAMSLGHVQQANAQNIVVDDLKNPNEVVGTKYDNLILNPNTSIKENYAKIDSLMSLHRENNYAKYIIWVIGHYVGDHKNSYDFHVGRICVKGKNNEEYHTISEQIVDALTELYSHSLDNEFKVENTLLECGLLIVNKKKAKVETGRFFKHQNGKITKEYIIDWVGGDKFWYLYGCSPLYKKIRDKVVAEIKFVDGNR